MTTTHNIFFFNSKVFRNNLIHSLLVVSGFLIFYSSFFFEVLSSDRLLAQPADGIAYYLPAFYGSRTLWTDLIFSGYPIAADPQNMTWYPPALILSIIPNSWNIFVILAYVLASSFAYYYIHIITSSKLAATAGGLIYGLNGFMIAYLPMATMIHAAAWIPLILCSLEKLRHSFYRSYILIGVVGIACCILAGSPQIFTYGIGLGVFYAIFLGWNAPIGRWKYYRLALTIFILGIGISTIQLIPTFELSRLSLRSDMSYESFLSGSLPLWQSLQLIFPFLFGNPWARFPYNSAYWGAVDWLGTAGYVGLLSLVLAIIGFVSYRSKGIARFWFWFGLVTLILAFGADLFLGSFLYYIPAYNIFRGQARHLLEFSLAISCLAGIGVKSIQAGWVSEKFISKIVIASLISIILILTSMIVFYPNLENKANLAGISHLKILPWNNPTVGIPCILILAGTFILWYWSRNNNSRLAKFLLVLILLLDLSSFSFWFRDWRVPKLAPYVKELEVPLVVKAYKSLTEISNQRFLTSEGMNVSWNENTIYPNLTRLWKLPNSSGYSPLMLTRYSQMMKMDFMGVLNNTPVTERERQLDLMSARYLLAPFSEPTQQLRLVWADSNTSLASLGSGVCTSSDSQSSTILDLTNISYEANAIGFVTTLGCSVQIPDQAEVVGIQVTDPQGQVENHSLLAGRDTAEYAYDCADVKPNMQHSRAQIFRSTSISRPGVSNCQIHDYVSLVQLNKFQQVKSLKINWSNFPGVINIKHISLINKSKDTSFPITPWLSKRWKKVDQTDSGIIYENQQVLPRTWLVPETTVLKPEEVLKAIHTSQLPDGRTYDPKTMALVEDAAARFQSPPLKSTDSAKVLKLEETEIELQTQTTAPSFLVLSDIFYPGWQATVDGKPTPIFQTNYIQRGIKVPGGNHIIKFEFHPLSFKVGVGITMASCFGCGYWLFRKPKTAP